MPSTTGWDGSLAKPKELLTVFAAQQMRSKCAYRESVAPGYRKFSSAVWIQEEAVEQADREAVKEAERKDVDKIRGDGQERTGGGLVCMSIRLTVSSPKGDPPSLHFTWTVVADCRANQEQKQTHAASLSQKHADTDSMLLSAAAC